MMLAPAHSEHAALVRRHYISRVVSGPQIDLLSRPPRPRATRDEMGFFWVVRSVVLDQSDQLRCVDSPPLNKRDAAALLARLNAGGDVLSCEAIRTDCDRLDVPEFPLLMERGS